MNPKNSEYYNVVFNKVYKKLGVDFVTPLENLYPGVWSLLISETEKYISKKVSKAKNGY